MGVWGERNRRGQLYFGLVKISCHIFQIKRAAAHSPLQHFKKVCQNHKELQY